MTAYLLAPQGLGEVPMACDASAWIDREVAGGRFADERLGSRLRTLLVQMAGAMGESIPLACQDWANTKAAYRFFANDRVSEGEILGGHFRSTRDRAAGVGGPVMVLHDTTEFSYRRRRPARVGQTCRVNSGKDRKGRFRMHTVCGLLMHASLAVTAEGLPLGLAAVKFWTRKKFKGSNALKRRSIRPGSRSSARRASAGWTTCASRQRCWMSRNDASTSAIARATSTSCSVWRRNSERT